MTTIVGTDPGGHDSTRVAGLSTIDWTPDKLYEAIKEHGLTIGAQARNGDELAKRVMLLYDMHYRCPGDPGALGLLFAAFGEWQQAQPSKS